MLLSKMKLTTVLGAAFVAAMPLTFAGRAAADPGPGLRWSDIAWGSRGTQARRAMPSYANFRSYSYPQAYSYAPAYYPQSSPAVVWATPVVPWSASAAPSTPTAQETVAIRGPDGVVRTFPVEGGAVQQQVALPGQAPPSYVSITGPDGVVRSYLVATTPGAVTGQVLVSPAQTGVTPVMTMPCR